MVSSQNSDPMDNSVHYRNLLHTRVQVFLLAFAKNIDQFATQEKVKIFNFACDHFESLVPKALFEYFESNIVSLFTPKALIGTSAFGVISRPGS